MTAVLCLYVVALLVWVLATHIRYKRRRVRARVERDARRARQDAAWNAWCDDVSKEALKEGRRPLPEWKEPT